MYIISGIALGDQGAVVRYRDTCHAVHEVIAMRQKAVTGRGVILCHERIAAARYIDHAGRQVRQFVLFQRGNA